MFSQRPRYFSQLTRSYPILKIFNIYDRQSFLRVYIFDNIYVCIFMYILFYAAIWYVNKIIKRIEKSNRDMLTTVADNKTKLDRLILLRNKKAEFEQVIVKTASSQKITTKHLEDEMHKLSAELIATSSKIVQLEKLIEKMVFSTNSQTNRLTIQPVSSQPVKVNIQRDSKRPQNRSRVSRSLSRRSHRLYHRNHHQGSTGSLSVGRLDNVQPRLQLHRQFHHRRKSYSSNSASAEASSESLIRHSVSRISSRDSSHHTHNDGDRKRYIHRKRILKTRSHRSSYHNMHMIHMNSLRNITPFTRSILGLATIFFHEHS